jgi:transposase-like protein
LLSGDVKESRNDHFDPRSSNGDRPNPDSYFVRSGGIFAILFSLRDVEELLEERGLNVDHTTVWRWVQCYSPELEQRLRRHLKPSNKSWRVDETYVRVKGRWCYLYRAVNSTGATIDFLLSALRDAGAESRPSVEREDL